MPTLINAPGGNSSALSYGAFRNRYKQVAASGGTSETTIYVAGLLEKVTRTSQPTEYRHTIRGGNGAAAIHVRRSNGTSDTYYLHKDHLGSPELITGNGGAVVVRASFSAYGERRDDDHDGAIPAGELAALANVTRRGFTGHEHLDGVGLIHMNGRVYEPRIGRFLGADPVVVAGHSQGVNPYAYVWNEPLRLTDPSGFCTDAVDCYESGFAPTIGGGLWNLALNRRIFQEPRVPSASPPSAPYESPAMQVPREGRATFSGVLTSRADVSVSRSASSRSVIGPIIIAVLGRIGIRVVPVEIVVDGGHATIEEAVRAAMKSIEGDYQKTKSAEELAGLLYRDERSGRYYHTTAGSVPAEFRVNFKTTSTSGTSDDWEAVGDFHTHPPRTGMDQEGFSIVDNDDLRVKQDEGKYGKSYRKYVRTPRGDIRVLENAETTIRNSTGKVPGRSICPNAQPCLPKHAAGAT